MGQATVDLPDPLDTPPTSLAGTDDLLAQMAGEEIDRLLAESGVEPDAPTPLAAPAVPPAPIPPPKPTETPVESGAPAARAPVVVEPAAPESDEEIAADAPPLSPALLESDAELDALLDEMSRAERDGLRGAPASPAEAPAPVAAEPSQNAGLVAGAAPAATEAHAGANAGAVKPPFPTTLVGADGPDASGSLMTAAERDALSLNGVGAATDRAASQSEGEGRTSLTVRVLEFLNAPLTFISDDARDVLGKVAIVTLVNALAVLVYVLFFRG